MICRRRARCVETLRVIVVEAARAGEAAVERKATRTVVGDSIEHLSRRGAAHVDVNGVRGPVRQSRGRARRRGSRGQDERCGCCSRLCRSPRRGAIAGKASCNWDLPIRREASTHSRTTGTSTRPCARPVSRPRAGDRASPHLGGRRGRSPNENAARHRSPARRVAAASIQGPRREMRSVRATRKKTSAYVGAQMKRPEDRNWLTSVRSDSGTSNERRR